MDNLPKSYTKIMIDSNRWVITEKTTDYLNPKHCITGTFDTETFVYLDNQILSQEDIYFNIKNMGMDEKRSRLSTKVWSWQFYDEINGFFMTNDFYTFLYYICLVQAKFIWCYNAKFDFAQIDYELLANRPDLWHLHDDAKGKGDSWSFASLHNDMGARYNYKLWIPYKRKGTSVNRHRRTHAVDFRDFMNIMPGGLRKILSSLDVKDNLGNDIRKLEMDYQSVDTDNLTNDVIEYCCNDVKGLYFAIKKYNEILKEQSNGEDCIFGLNTNVFTAGGIAKKALLRELYPNLPPNNRLKKYQKAHPITIEQDAFYRKNGLYRGGICIVNPKWQGKLLNKMLYRYDVNSEYPFAMSQVFDLKGKPIVKSYTEWLNSTDKSNYECILMLDFVTGPLRENKVAVWFDPFRCDYVDYVDEHNLHLIFEREFEELQQWYDLDFGCEKVILYKKGDQIYKPFVDKYYELKAKAKKALNAGLTADAKLKLNSSYGKLAERLIRQNGFYAKNETTGAIHFVKSSEEIDDNSRMNVAVGALVASIARIWILSHIRKICKNVADEFVYIDTDSIHCFTKFNDADAYKLGALKLEAICCNAKYLAPKCYIDVEEREGEVVTKFECHTKGLNVRYINDMVKKNPNINNVDEIFSYGQKFKSLQAINVVGGKALILVEKFLAMPELAPNEFVATTYKSNYGDLSIEYEV